MKTTSGLIAATLGVALLAPLAAGATDSNAWLQRQFSTVHRDSDAPPTRAEAPGIRHPDGAGHAFSEAWLKRQFAGEALAMARDDGLAGRAGPIDTADTSTPLSDAWLHHQFTTDHPSPGSRY